MTSTGAVLHAQTVADFEGGKWVSWDLAGHVVIRVTNQVPGLNAVVSGLFFDPTAATAPVRTEPPLVTSVAYGADGLPMDVTDPRGIVSRTLYDLLGRTTSTTAAFGTAAAFTVNYAYDGGGRLQSVTAPGGRTTKYAYDARERVSQVTERFGTAFERKNQFAYDDLGGLLSATDPLDTRTDYVENTLGRVVSVTAAANVSGLARTASAAFDVLGRVLSATDPRNFTTNYSYDDINRQVTVTDPLLNAWTSAFDKAGRTVSVTDPYGKSTAMAYDLPGRLVSVTDPLNHASTFQYWVNGTEDRATDALTHTTRQSYDQFGRVGTVYDGLNNPTSFLYDRNSNVVSVTNAKGVSTAFGYDFLDRAVTVTEAVGRAERRTTGYAYNGYGDLTTVTDPLGRQTAFAHDAAGRVTTRTAAANKAEAFQVAVGYDLLDRVVSVTRPGSRTTGYAYDALSQLTKATEGVGTSLVRHTTFGYDAAGNTVSVTDPLNQTTGYAYDKLNRVTAITDALAGVVQVAYDKAGRRASLTDPVLNETKWGYDDAGRLTTETDPLGKVTTYAYDAADRPTGVTDRLGRVREFGYDAANRVTSETWKAAGGAVVQTQTFGYDAVGNQTSATDPDGSYALAYDNLNRVVNVAGPFGVTQAFEYDAADNRTKATDNKGTVTTSTFDNLNRLVSRAQAVGGANVLKADWTYDAKGDRTALSRSHWSGGAWQKAGDSGYTFDALGRQTGIDHRNASGVTVGGASYTLDLGDRVMQQIINGVTQTFTYDLTNQLTADTGTGYTYDKAGNRTMAGYATDPGNRTTSDGTWTYEYNAEGQMFAKSKSGEVWSYTYDHRGQLVAADKRATPGGAVTDSATYKYDAWGVRVGRTQTGTVNSTEQYVVDGWDTAKPGAIGTENFDAVVDLDGAGNVTQRRVFGGGFDEIVARNAGGAVSWAGADALGSVRQVFDNAGNVIGSRTYAAFGGVVSQTGGGFDRHGWSGTATDPLTGLVGDDARVYDTSIGRWLSGDPLGFAGGDANLSRYVGNSPTNATDPSGLEIHFHTDLHGHVIVLDGNKTVVGVVEDIGGISHVRKNGRVVELERVIQDEASSGSLGHDGWKKYFADKGEEFKPGGFENKTIVSGGGDLNDYLNQLSTRGACTNTQMGTSNGQSYNVAGNEAAGLIREMITSVAADVALDLTGSGALKLLGFVGKKGWKVLRGKGGKVIGVLDQGGNKVDKDKFAQVLGEFQKKHPTATAKPAIKASPKPAVTCETPKPKPKVCFPAGTPVHVSAGLTAIELVAVGDRVWAFDHRRVRWSEREVTATHTYEHDGLMATVTIAGETVRATGGHPYWVVRGEQLSKRPKPVRIAAYEASSNVEGRWVLARDLRVGDVVLLRHAGESVVEAVSVAETRERVYNFTVADLQNYAVGDRGVLVHNTNDPPAVGPENTGPSRLHADTTLKPSSLDFWRKQSDRDIVESLRSGKVPGGSSGRPEPMVVENGVIKQGNHRVKALEDRGYTTQQIIEMVEGKRPVGNPANLPAPGAPPARPKLTKEEAERLLFGDPPPPPPGPGGPK